MDALPDQRLDCCGKFSFPEFFTDLLRQIFRQINFRPRMLLKGHDLKLHRYDRHPVFYGSTQNFDHRLIEFSFRQKFFQSYNVGVFFRNFHVYFHFLTLSFICVVYKIGEILVEFQENIIFRTTFQEIHDQISINNMGEVKIEFQENNNGLRFLAQTVVPYGNIFL